MWYNTIKCGVCHVKFIIKQKWCADSKRGPCWRFLTKKTLWDIHTMKITKSCALLLMLESGNDEHKKAGFAHLSLVKLKKKSKIFGSILHFPILPLMSRTLIKLTQWHFLQEQNIQNPHPWIVVFFFFFFFSLLYLSQTVRAK